jgi:uncharacterized delta-60 repeat protein
MPVGGQIDRARAAVLQPDGKLVIAGACHNGPYSVFCAVRLNADGALDTSWAGASPFGAGKLVLSVGVQSDDAYALAAQPDGKVLLAGSCSPANGNRDFCTVRLNADGSLDNSWAAASTIGAGKQAQAVGVDQDYARAIVLQPDGKVLLAGNCNDGSANNFCAIRLSADGTLDSTWAPTSTFGPGRLVLSVGGGNDFVTAAALQPDGKFLISGTCYNGVNNDFCAVRLTANGTLDTSWAAASPLGAGRLLVPVGGDSDAGSAMALQPDGKVLIAGGCESSPSVNAFCVVRFNGNGTLDTSFSGDGKIFFAVVNADHDVSALALQPDGKVLLGGRCWNGSNYDFCAVRWNTNGSLDSTWAETSSFGAGRLLQPVGNGDDSGSAIALLPDGKVLITGSCGPFANPSFCVIRLDGGPFGYQNCKPDYDGDGKVLATTDALILARVALGMTSSAVTNGITFPATATRTTWSSIRNYLVTQCGMSLIQ